MNNAQQIYTTHVCTTVQLWKRPWSEEDMTISFYGKDMTQVTTPYDDALVITVVDEGLDMKRIIVDGEA